MSSDAHHFVETLQSIGYKPAKQLTPSLVEWMFDTRTTPFLVWFSNSVSQSNVLRPEEITEFSKLEEDGVRILEADQVEKILNFSDLFNDDSELESQEILRNKMYELKGNKKLLQERKEALLKRRHLLSARLASLKNNFFRAENSQKNGKQSYHESEQKAQVANNSTSASNGRLKESVNLINSLYEESGSPDLEPQDDAVFLSQVNLKHLQKLEDRFIQEVTITVKNSFLRA
ncbi:HAUS augmin-like complex subunit 3 isoform X1 [Liolophura sinensis]|uniref:HAUS augmin-like complex subunit 3 isoform X1 n=1 Tax=Liolophura sinensis TaxID=3198878 RepID=UPI0031585C75